LQAAVGPRHPLHYTRPGTVGQVLIDRTQFSRALLNLVVNARDAMPGGGPIEVRLAPVKLTGNPSYSGRFVMLEVSDHGLGMAEAPGGRASEPFFTTKSKGTGLGLAIVHHVVDRAGGLVRIESAPARGTTFRLFFPHIGATTGESAVFAVPPELREDAR